MQDDVLIQIEDVTRVYTTGANEVRALDGVSLTVRRGEMLAIMGASGSGKSTLMNILGALDVPTSGTYVLDGTRVDGMSRNELADIRNAKIGFVFQTFNLVARTSALENVELPMLYDRAHRHRNPREQAIRALTRVGLADRLRHESTELSGGEQQRVAIARALVTEPSILLADEPTGNLDSHTTLDVLALFQELNDQGMTVLMVTHERDVAQCARRLMELHDGRVIHDEPVMDRHRAAEDAERLKEVA
jgi:putative ABC transport system ATP-binding protein